MTPAVVCMTTDEAQTWVARGHCLATDLADWYREGEEREAWRALGYGSIRECVATELRLEGRSYREIGELMGVSHQTVANELRTVKDLTVALPERITGLDGKSRPAVRPNLTEAVRQHFTGATRPAARVSDASATRANLAYRRANGVMTELLAWPVEAVAEGLGPESARHAIATTRAWVAWLERLQELLGERA